MYINDDLYKDIMSHSIIATVDIIFVNHEWKILLWYRNNKPLQWIYYIPWWRVIKGELILDAAKRKAKEELGFDIDSNKLQFLWVYDDVFHDSKYHWVSTHCVPRTYVYHLSKEEEQSIKAWDNQHEDMKFFAIDDENLHPMVQERVGDMRKNWFITKK